MRKYAAQRLVLGIPTILGAAILIFVIMRVVPGDVAILIAIGGSEGEEEISAAAIEKMRDTLGLNEPLYMQFATWMWAKVPMGQVPHPGRELHVQGLV